MYEKYVSGGRQRRLRGLQEWISVVKKKKKKPLLIYNILFHLNKLPIRMWRVSSDGARRAPKDFYHRVVRIILTVRRVISNVFGRHDFCTPSRQVRNLRWQNRRAFCAQYRIAVHGTCGRTALRRDFSDLTAAATTSFLSALIYYTRMRFVILQYGTNTVLTISNKPFFRLPVPHACIKSERDVFFFFFRFSVCFPFPLLSILTARQWPQSRPELSYR